MDETLFRNVVQVGMVVSDLDQTLEKFQSLLGIRPFRTVEYPPVGEEGCLREYRGKSGDFTARFCFFNLGGIELEVIQPLTGDSIWSDFLRDHGPGLHHLKFPVDRLEPARRQLEENGFRCVQQGAAAGPNKGRMWVYYEHEPQKDLPLCIEIMNEVIDI